MNTPKKKSTSTEGKIGLKMRYDKRLDVLEGRILFPAKLEKANKLIATLDLNK